MRLVAAIKMQITWSLKFQFHSGAISSENQVQWGSGCVTFQFHSGAISSIISQEQAINTPAFQFHSGAISSFLPAKLHRDIELISIPLWCD